MAAGTVEESSTAADKAERKLGVIGVVMRIRPQSCARFLEACLANFMHCNRGVPWHGVFSTAEDNLDESAFNDLEDLWNSFAVSSVSAWVGCGVLQRTKASEAGAGF